MTSSHQLEAAAHIEADTLTTLRKTSWRYWLLLLAMVSLTAAGGWAWSTMLRRGLGVSGMNSPVMWGAFITSFVFFIGISHSGTLVSAILYFTRSPLRPAIGRSAEAMTVIAIMTAGLYPLIHMGRTWFFFWLLPYPNQRGLWPNFHSPLVWDIFAVCCYVTISALFLYMGMIPDLALLSRKVKGWRRRLYKLLSLGFSGTDAEWNLLDRAYPIFAGVAIPLAVSVHSVVSWDFAMTMIPGWHSTIFAPYFVAGAIFSGLAMAIVLLAMLRRAYRLERYIRADHFDVMAKLLLAMSIVMSFVYITEFLTAMLRGSPAERTIFIWRATGRYALVYWLVILCNCLIPLLALKRRIRRNLRWMIVISVAVLVGMWFERFMFVVTSLAHHYDPFSWGAYLPTLPEVLICLAGFGCFGSLFLIFIKVFPALAVTETMQGAHEEVPVAATEVAHA